MNEKEIYEIIDKLENILQILEKGKVLRFQLTTKINDIDYTKLHIGKVFEIDNFFRYPSKATRITFKEVN